MTNAEAGVLRIVAAALQRAADGGFRGDTAALWMSTKVAARIVQPTANDWAISAIYDDSSALQKLQDDLAAL